ncbi:uncharacterized protein CIMG_12484 [Coccidioides immitis RS]|uniref:Uncharacterized protein n=3 Tax=Coccidioides immitis TaxID=5501 RepID=A0A0D8JWD5_COCIM|nr:uncharacterized protein CIMG_12484 [Coccidioides immitis RS]KJF61241.1 hypothetical protein CIMG_12484 [Coccidioides immitis RS]KMP09379.1 hypothetical protein CIRG_09549 [Coccidioides immitis RMSCC 2394]KMU75314.1 hypothetical protein CISG_04733 [Coccidioides immitis RMSCC 3703]
MQLAHPLEDPVSPKYSFSEYAWSLPTCHPGIIYHLVLWGSPIAKDMDAGNKWMAVGLHLLSLERSEFNNVAARVQYPLTISKGGFVILFYENRALAGIISLRAASQQMLNTIGSSTDCSNNKDL